MISAILDDIGGCLLFLRKVFACGLNNPVPWASLSQQIWDITTESLTTTAVAGFFVGAIMATQFAVEIRGFGAMGFLGGLATSATVREVGPLLIAFMLSGKIGAFTSAQLGTMRVTEQIDAIRCLGADPIYELVLPRFIGIVISSFFLLGLGLLMSVFGGMFFAIAFVHTSPEEYLRHVPTVVSSISLISGLFKCFVFASLLGAVCTYKGYTVVGGAKGVGRAVVNTAVASMVGLVVADFLTSLIIDAIVQIGTNT